MKQHRGAQLAAIMLVAVLAFDIAPGAVPAQILTTNNLWVCLTGFSNHTASLVIHRPWDDTNLTHDLFYATNLNAPAGWQFKLRCIYSNVVVSNLGSPQGFFRLGQTNGALTVNSNTTAEELAELLVPPGLTPLNAVYTGTNVARGMFSGGNGCGLPLDSGVILATGDITNAIGPNTVSGVTTAFGINGDSDLDHLVGGGPTFDGAVLEFDVVPTNNMILGFQYIFASDEYPEWIGPFNDPMAIFVSTNRMATNWINTNNIALVPGTQLPVSINTVNGGCASTVNNGQVVPTNPQFYVDNHDPTYPAMPPYSLAAPAFNIQYDGMTVLLTAQVTVCANVTNHVKIAIADYGDDQYDSAVFVRTWTPCQ